MKKKITIKKQDFAVLPRLLKRLFSEYKWQMVVIVLCIFVGAIGQCMMPVIMKNLIDNIIFPGILNGLDSVTAEITSFLIFICSVCGAGVICSYIWATMCGIYTQKFIDKFRKDVFNHMQQLPIKYFDTHTHGDVMSTYTNDIDALHQMVAYSIPSIINSLVIVVSIIVIMLTYSVWLFLVEVFGIIMIFIVAKTVGVKSTKYFIKQQEVIGSMEGYVEEIINGQKVVKVFNHEDSAKQQFVEANNKVFGASSSAHSYGNMMMPIMSNIGNLLYVLVAFIGGIFVLTGVTNVSLSEGLTKFSIENIGVVVSFLSMSRAFTNSIGQTSQEVNAIAMGIAGSKRVFEVLDEPIEYDEGYVTLVNAKEENGSIVECEERTEMWAWKHPHKELGTTTYEKLQGKIELHDVDFGYTDDKMVLNDIDIVAHPGEKVAFVGSTGAGKTTITNLINRFYDIADGKVRYDDININKIKKSDLRKTLGVVLQDVNLFTGTVMDNIRYGRLDATDEECIKAAKLANADSFIERLPEGYNTLLKNAGDDLSQGQKQLISIARAAVADPPVMILDEATSSIDTRTEVLVEQGMDSLMKGRTVFVIAHRLSTIRNADEIIVLEKGRIVEQGNHDSLIAKKGRYYELYTGKLEME